MTTFNLTPSVCEPFFCPTATPDLHCTTKVPVIATATAVTCSRYLTGPDGLSSPNRSDVPHSTLERVTLDALTDECREIFMVDPEEWTYEFLKSLAVKAVEMLKETDTQIVYEKTHPSHKSTTAGSGYSGSTSNPPRRTIQHEDLYHGVAIGDAS
ncbi:hypothetical protein LTR56_006680 [Elasticomyces elasticus]|nr:hypothetical protein LTR22_012845 [Elasticomyces elasticus]KAK3649781.1 hypothetical protein LTR56_006680 [Elasticomyces elasticus]KAK4918116.1 hypothetical protein LTR49_014120 [Elasticomyces elasticus]KAK5757385.1 hypothetical protein LTS12_012468 [Elasticomyces elasticus]